MDDSKLIDELISYADELQENEPDNTFYVVKLDDDSNGYEVVAEDRDSGRQLQSIHDPAIEHFTTRIVYASGE
jgi:hypothetical protein